MPTRFRNYPQTPVPRTLGPKLMTSAPTGKEVFHVGGLHVVECQGAVIAHWCFHCKGWVAGEPICEEGYAATVWTCNRCRKQIALKHVEVTARLF